MLTHRLAFKDRSYTLIDDLLCLSPEEISKLGDEDLLQLLRFYQEQGELIYLIDFFESYPQYMSDDELETLASHPNAPEAVRHQAEGALLFGISSDSEPVAPAASPAPTTSEPGYVYLAYCSTGHYKIGRSKSPEKRIKVFDTKMPVDIELVHVFEADDYAAAERQLHNTFADQRFEGEWFDLSQSEVTAIQSIERYQDGDFIPGDFNE